MAPLQKHFRKRSGRGVGGFSQSPPSHKNRPPASYSFVKKQNKNKTKNQEHLYTLYTTLRLLYTIISLSIVSRLSIGLFSCPEAEETFSTRLSSLHSSAFQPSPGTRDNGSLRWLSRWSGLRCQNRKYSVLSKSTTSLLTSKRRSSN